MGKVKDWLMSLEQYPTQGKTEATVQQYMEYAYDLCGHRNGRAESDSDPLRSSEVQRRPQGLLDIRGLL